MRILREGKSAHPELGKWSVRVNLRMREGKSAQFAFRVKRKRPGGRCFFAIGLVEFGARWLLLN